MGPLLFIEKPCDYRISIKFSYRICDLNYALETLNEGFLY